MKAISLWNPWAHLMAIGVKKNETRDWYTNVRGEVAIHAATKWDKRLDRMLKEEPFSRFIKSKDEMAFGAVVAVGELREVVPADAELPFLAETGEYELGDYTSGRFVWKFGNVRPLKRPFIVIGRQGFFSVDIPSDFLSSVDVPEDFL